MHNLSSSPHRCALCNVPLSETNDTEEHIIPNSIGGRRTVRGFICNPCNNNRGDHWDNAVAKQFTSIALITGIKRQHGDVPPIKFEDKDGKTIALSADGQMKLTGKAVVTESVGSSGITTNIRAGTDKEADKIAEGFSKKYNKQGINNIEYSKKYIAEEISEDVEFEFSFGDKGSGKSYVKTAMALASKNGISIDECECAKDFLVNDGYPCFGYYYAKEVLINRPEFLHIVTLEGNPKEKLLLSYIEYFSFFRIVVCLSRNYLGKAFKDSYALDPRAGGQLDIDFNVPLSACEIESLYNCDYYNPEVLGASLKNVLSLSPRKMQS